MCRRLILSALITGITLLFGVGLALAQGWPLDSGLQSGNTTQVYYNHNENGDYTGKETKTVENQFGIANTIRYSCKPPKPCEICGSCHVSSRTLTVPSGASVERARQLATASVNRHNQTHIPAALMRLSAGQRVPWGAQNYLSVDGRDLVLHGRSGQPLVAYPAGTQILKNPQGDVVGLLIGPSGEPRVLSRTP